MGGYEDKFVIIARLYVARGTDMSIQIDIRTTKRHNIQGGTGKEQNSEFWIGTGN